MRVLGPLRLFLYNPLSLIAVGRRSEVAHELGADAVLLPGTRIRSWSGRQYQVEKLGDGYSAIHFGWAASAWTN
eukprot:3865955-Pyramimonas_sp.AAC.1